jgi:hypothetical protein
MRLRLNVLPNGLHVRKFVVSLRPEIQRHVIAVAVRKVPTYGRAAGFDSLRRMLYGSLEALLPLRFFASSNNSSADSP